MTALAQRIKETPMAPYTGLLDGMTREQKMIVVTYITESMEKPKGDVVEQVRRKYGVAESESTKWFREHAKAAPEWDRQEAWNRLTDKQREEATRLKLTAEDMDERTVAIIEKQFEDAMAFGPVRDFEDMLQYQCAKAAGYDIIVTNNGRDFAEFSDLPIMTAEEMLQQLDD